MAEVFSTSFEATGIESGWAQVVGTGCTLDWDSTTVARPAGGGDETLKSIAASTGFEAYGYKDLGSGNGKTKSFSRAYVYVNAEGLANGQVKAFFGASDNSNNSVWQALLYQTGGILYLTARVYNNGAWAYMSSAPTISLDEWHYVEFKYDDDNNLWEFKVDGTSYDSGSLTGVHRTECRYWAIGLKNEPSASVTATIYCDLVKVDDAAYPGEEPAISIPVMMHHYTKNIGQ